MSSSPAAFQLNSGRTPTKQHRTPLGALDANTNKAVSSHRDALHDECERRLQAAQAEFAKKYQQMRQEFENAECEIEQWQQSYSDIQEQGKQLHAAYEIKCIKVKELGGQLEEAKVPAPHCFFYDDCVLTHLKVVLAQQNSISSQMKEELIQSQQINDEREAAYKQLEVQYAEALQRIASMERAQRTMEEEMRSVKMAARQSLPAAVDDVQITSLKDKITRLENELQHMKSSPPVAPPPITSKRVSLDSLSADELKSNYETLSIRNDLVQEELQRVQAVCDRLQDELVRLRSDAAADRDACSNMQLSLSNERAASDALERSLHALQSELSGVYSKLQDQECNGSSLQRLEQEMKRMQQQAGAAAEQLRAKELALLEVQRKLADEHAR